MRLNYEHFDSKMTYAHGIVIHRWPFETKRNPSKLTIAQMNVLIDLLSCDPPKLYFEKLTHSAHKEFKLKNPQLNPNLIAHGDNEDDEDDTAPSVATSGAHKRKAKAISENQSHHVAKKKKSVVLSPEYVVSEDERDSNCVSSGAPCSDSTRRLSLESNGANVNIALPLLTSNTGNLIINGPSTACSNWMPNLPVASTVQYNQPPDHNFAPDITMHVPCTAFHQNNALYSFRSSVSLDTGALQFEDPTAPMDNVI